MLETAGKELFQALFNVQQQLDGIVKDASNPFFKSSYADRTTVLNTLKPLYAKEGLLIIQVATTPYALAFGDEHKEEKVEGGTESKSQPVAALALSTVIVHVASGQYIESTAVVPLPQSDPQGYGSALTYTSRYALVMQHALPLLDDDGNSASKQPTSKSQAKRIVKEKTGPQSTYREVGGNAPLLPPSSEKKSDPIVESNPAPAAGADSTPAAPSSTQTTTASTQTAPVAPATGTKGRKLWGTPQ